MLRRIAYALLGLMSGYAMAALAGYALIVLASGNSRETRLESAMTVAFVTCPFGAILGLIGAWVVTRCPQDSADWRICLAATAGNCGSSGKWAYSS